MFNRKLSRTMIEIGPSAREREALSHGLINTFVIVVSWTCSVTRTCTTRVRKYFRKYFRVRIIKDVIKLTVLYTCTEIDTSGGTSTSGNISVHSLLVRCLYGSTSGSTTSHLRKYSKVLPEVQRCTLYFRKHGHTVPSDLRTELFSKVRHRYTSTEYVYVYTVITVQR